MKVINATFSVAVRMPNFKNENFIKADEFTSLDWDSKLDALIIKQQGKKDAAIVFRTNISQLLVEFPEKK
jgi:hypothetical protein